MRLTHANPICTPDGHGRLVMALRGSCPCTSDDATLTKRLTASGVYTVHLQCQGCGRSIGGALKRSEFPTWEGFAEWDLAKIEAYDRQSLDAVARRRGVVMQNLIDQRADYARWCATSEAWPRLRALVIRRANGVCEACLQRPAATAHHLTYKLGKEPPGWCLRAVCQTCHDRLHADKHGEQDERCPVLSCVE